MAHYERRHKLKLNIDYFIIYKIQDILYVSEVSDCDNSGMFEQK